MTLQQQTLSHLIKMAKLDKKYAWWAANHYAKLHPDELGEMPALLTSAMLSQSSNANATDTKDATR